MPIKGRYEKGVDGDWVVYDDVPVFDEHVGDDGVQYDARLLRQIAKNNNDRIDDTGDYCPIVIGHTNDDDKSIDPPVIGFAGPFRLGKIGKKKPRWSILGQFRIRASKDEEFRSRPRRSVEIWPEDRPEKRYFDPIAVLGAETPKRDLGLVYSRRDPSKRVMRYEMGGGSVPGAMNTSVPAATPVRNEKENGMPLSPDDVNQIVEALRPTIQDMIQAELGGEKDQGQGLLPEDDIEGDEPSEMPEDAPPEGEPMSEPSPEGEDMPADDEQAMGKGLFAKACSKYSLRSSKPDMDGARAYFASMDDAQRGSVERYCQCDKSAKELYEKCCSAPRDQYRKRVESGEVERYRKAAETAKSELEKAKRRYAKSQEDLLASQDTIIDLRQKLRYSRIDSQLAELIGEGYAIDREDELKTLVALPDDLVDQQLRRIKDHYAKVPRGSISEVQSRGIEGDEALAIRYSKAAAAATSAFREQGHRGVRYETILRWMYANQTDAMPRLEDVQSAS